MAADKTTVFGYFQPLFNKNVPHILEKIFFSLDYDSFISCQDVCNTWNGLFSSALYNTRSKKLLFEKNKREDDLCYLIGFTRCPWGRDYLNKIKDFLSSGTNPNCCQGKPLYYATRGSTRSHIQTDTIKLLLGAGADPNMKWANGMTPLHFAVNYDYRAIKMLLDAGALPNIANQNGETPLHMAVESGHVECAKVLLKYGADPNMTNLHGETVIHIIEKYMRRNDDRRRITVIVPHLLDAGLDPNGINISGQSLLHMALSLNNPRYYYSTGYIVQHLLDCGADPNLTNRRGKTPLNVAAGIWIKPNNIGCINALLDAGADHSVADRDGDTLLHKAVASYDLEHCKRINNLLVKRLLRAGADPNRANKRGVTALSLAARAGRNDNGLLKLLNKAVNKKATFEDINDESSAQPRKRLKLLKHLDETVW